jgi:S-DNA-T family DNA segregation ATPase FtsK/SpoIIIE
VSDSKYRAIALSSAIVLGFCSLVLSAAILGAIMGLPGFERGPGAFLAACYGLLALGIPAFLFYAAFILADKAWRPDRIFLLAVSLFPFMTLATGVVFVRDYDINAPRYLFLELAGKTGFSFTIAALTVLEVLVITVLKFLLFPKNGEFPQNARHPVPAGSFQFPAWLKFPGFGRENPGKAGGGGERDGKSKNNKANSPAGGAPERGPGQGPAGAGAGEAAPLWAEPLIESAAGGAPPGTEEGPAITTAPETAAETAPQAPETEQEGAGAESPGGGPEIELPEPRPLASVAAMKKLEARRAGGAEGQDPDTEAGEPEIDPAFPAGAGDSPGYPGGLSGEPGGPVEVVSVKPRPVPKTKIRGSWKVPVEILNRYPDGEYWIIDDATRAAAVTLRATLEEFHIQAEVTGIRKGPVITMFEILPAPGVKLSKIVNLQDNIALRLAASSVRIVAPIPGKHAVGIEVPNAKRNIVSFREIIEGELHREGKKEAQIPVVLGKDITGEAQTTDLTQTPHLLIAGATGSGKSVCVNSMILSILYQKAPAECRLILIDPKIVELKLYNDIPHLLTPVITEPKRAFQALQYLIFEMERRYACLDSMGVRDIKSYNKRIRERNIAAEHLPYIVVVIDEFADLMATTGKELESTVARLAAMSRAVGIHLVLATQRPSIDVITGLIKANIPSRIAFMVASKMDSRIIIDQVGAEKLLGKGDMLYAGVVDPFPIRMQGAFISEEEVETVVEYVKTLGKPDYIDDEIFYDDEDDDADPSLFSDGDDPLYEKALEIVLQQGKASASYIQRRLKIGYNRAARLVELMEQNGVVGPAQGSKPRELLRAFSS